MERRLREAAKLGFTGALVPKVGAPKPGAIKGMHLIACGTVQEVRPTRAHAFLTSASLHPRGRDAHPIIHTPETSK